ncbi:hypothetical protein A2U01_0082958, partial [Trifolium medium]|nr:hypothetical protein [Trifolium medium]
HVDALVEQFAEGFEEEDENLQLFKNRVVDEVVSVEEQGKVGKGVATQPVWRTDHHVGRAACASGNEVSSGPLVNCDSPSICSPAEG